MAILSRTERSRGQILQIGRRRQRNTIWRLPEVQAERVLVDIIRSRMELDHGFVSVPEEIFDETHLIPCGASIVTSNSDGYVFPAVFLDSA